jgi:hypothetical protein
LRIENPIGYKNVLLHMKAHMQMIQQALAAEAANQVNSQQAAKPDGTSTPLAENEDVAVQS